MTDEKSFTFVDRAGNLVLRSPEGDTVLVPAHAPSPGPAPREELIHDLVIALELMIKNLNDVGIPTPAAVAFILAKAKREG